MSMAIAILRRPRPRETHEALLAGFDDDFGFVGFGALNDRARDGKGSIPA